MCLFLASHCELGPVCLHAACDCALRVLPPPVYAGQGTLRLVASRAGIRGIRGGPRAVATLSPPPAAITWTWGMVVSEAGSTAVILALTAHAYLRVFVVWQRKSVVFLSLVASVSAFQAGGFFAPTSRGLELRSAQRTVSAPRAAGRKPTALQVHTAWACVA